MNTTTKLRTDSDLCELIDGKLVVVEAAGSIVTLIRMVAQPGMPCPDAEVRFVSGRIIQTPADDLVPA